MTAPEPPWIVTCAKCGHTQPGQRTRLFWAPGGTFRICATTIACDRRAERRAAALAKEDKP